MKKVTLGFKDMITWGLMANILLGEYIFYLTIRRECATLDTQVGICQQKNIEKSYLDKLL